MQFLIYLSWMSITQFLSEDGLQIDHLCPKEWPETTICQCYFENSLYVSAVGIQD